MRLIDADSIKYNYYMVPETTDSHKIAVSKDKIDAMPTIDAEQVIHCYDCKHGEPWYEDDGFRRCTKIQQYGKVYPGDHYCGYAKRWEEE